MATQLAILSQSPVTRQLGVMFGLAAAVALGVAVVFWGREPTYGVLYSGLGGQDAGAVVEQLRKDNVKFRLDQATGAIMVPADKVHELRLQLASAGLPQSAGVGFNVLERKQEFGTSQFMENARYQHALEEELARTIAAVSHIESARVHLALPKQSVFVRKRQEPSASVLVNLFPGRTLEKEQVSAITHLVASSIPNMEPGRVTVVDQKGRLLSDENLNPQLSASKEQFEHTRTLEDAYVQRIENILTPVLGPDGVRAQVSAEVDYSITEQTQETFNPETAALRSEQRFEQTSEAAEAQGIPGALSNQPPGAGVAPETLPMQGTAAEGEPTRTVKRATVNYELDRTISHTRSAVGQVKRLTVAVVVDDKLVPNEEGNLVRAPRTAEELERITTLVRDAVGFSAERGDTVNVVNVSFNEVQALEPLPEPPLWKQAWLWDVVKEIFAWTIAAVVLLFALRAVIRSFGAVRSEPQAAAAAQLAGPGMAEDHLSLSSSTPTVQLPGPDQTYEENLNQARQMALQDPKRVAQVVRSWIASDEK